MAMFDARSSNIQHEIAAMLLAMADGEDYTVETGNHPDYRRIDKVELITTDDGGFH